MPVELQQQISNNLLGDQWLDGYIEQIGVDLSISLDICRAARRVRRRRGLAPLARSPAMMRVLNR